MSFDTMLARAGRTAGAALLATLAAAAAGGQDLADVTITRTQVADGIYMLEGQGGNIAISVGDDGVFMIDDQFAPLTEKIKASIAEVSGKPVSFIINTHWHGDHTGGNENFAAGGSVIVAHENVRQRMSVDQFQEAFGTTRPAAPEAALPVITFTDTVTFHWNGDAIRVFHVAPAHTDGDAVIHFQGANVIHTGDVVFNGFYPFVDTSAGGSLDGVVTAVDGLLGTSDVETRLIPGHGPLATRDDLVRYRDMLTTVRDRLREAIGAGKSLEATLNEAPTREFEEAGWGRGFLSSEKFVTTLYRHLQEGR